MYYFVDTRRGRLENIQINILKMSKKKKNSNYTNLSSFRLETFNYNFFLFWEEILTYDVLYYYILDIYPQIWNNF